MLGSCQPAVPPKRSKHRDPCLTASVERKRSSAVCHEWRDIAEKRLTVSGCKECLQQTRAPGTRIRSWFFGCLQWHSCLLFAVLCRFTR